MELRARPLSLAACVAVAAIGLSFIGSTCDLAADDCDEPESNRCTADNAAVICRRPVPEAHRSEKSTPCGASVCTMGADHVPFCARPNAACTGPKDSECANDVFSTCRAVADGGFMWSDVPCDPGTKCEKDAGQICPTE